MKDETRYLGHTSVRCVVPVWQKAFKTWISNKHQFWQSALKDHERSSKISRAYHCGMCGWTFARHSAIRNWIPNTHQFRLSSFKGHEQQDISAIPLSDVWMYFCLTFSFQDLKSQQTSIQTWNFYIAHIAGFFQKLQLRARIRKCLLVWDFYIAYIAAVFE